MKKKIAGHEWVDDHIDSQCCITRASESCLMTRALLFQATPADVGTAGFAHVGNLNQSEYDEIIRERDAYKLHCEKLMDALRAVCG